MRFLDSNIDTSQRLKCTHCDEPILLVHYHEQLDPQHQKPFCCQGCLTVYEILNVQGLQEYYDIKNQSQIFKRRSPVTIQKVKYLYLDDSEFLKEFSYKNLAGLDCMEFYLEGIHCLACLWLIEKLPSLVEGVMGAKLDLEKSQVIVSKTPNGKFSQVAQVLNNLGYKPHVLKKNQSTQELKIKEERQQLLRIGIAAAGASNIMLYAVSLYAGADKNYAIVFNALTVFFAVPVFGYSAYPFYKNAWQSLKNKTLSIDFPISVSLLMGFGFGIYNLFKGVNENYFDSLTTLVFLLLLSRYFLKKIQDRALTTKDLHYFYQGESVLKSVNNTMTKFEEIHPKYIAVDDILKIQPTEFFPADGIVLQGESLINMALLTGESKPKKIIQNDSVYAGTQNISNEILMQVQKIHQSTRVGEILKSVESGWTNRAPISGLADKISQYFILTVLLLSVVLFIKYALIGNLHLAIEQALTLLIVTCPCALAISIPLTMTKALNLAAENGIIIKSETIIQKLAQIKNIFIDKTGTLTLGKLKVINFKCIQKCKANIDISDSLISLEKTTTHPVGIALRDYAIESMGKYLKVEDFSEIPGIGVEGKIAGHLFQINKMGIWEDGELIATYEVQESLQSEAKQEIEKLSKLKLPVTIVSGDEKSRVEEVANELGIKIENIFSQLSPEDKSTLVAKTPFSMMVGDGANDAIAFTKAHVGVAVLGSMEMALKASDIYLVQPGLTSISKLIILGREVLKIINRNFLLSLIYNLISITLVFMGVITPLIAAIIMPLSSLTVLLSTIYGSKKMRNLWK